MWPALIAGALTTGASLFGGSSANAMNRREAQKSRDFTERMSSTAHQREVKDLRAAGLNPILSATGGSGSSTPSGATAQQSDAVTPAVTSGVNSAISIIRTLAEANKTMAETQTELKRPSNIEASTSNLGSATALNRTSAELKDLEKISVALQPQYIKSQTEASTSAASLNRANVSKAKQETENLKTEKLRIEADTALKNASTLNETTRNLILGQDVEVAKRAASKALNDREIDQKTFGKVMAYLDRLIKTISPIAPKP
ncbi:MAG: DNA pilot protein [Microviridae sp.]|nr:MAG: DNA pilot protein [Microviridae sp.]